jgi:hypothetical protein
MIWKTIRQISPSKRAPLLLTNPRKAAATVISGSLAISISSINAKRAAKRKRKPAMATDLTSKRLLAKISTLATPVSKGTEIAAKIDAAWNVCSVPKDSLNLLLQRTTQNLPLSPSVIFYHTLQSIAIDLDSISSNQPLYADWPASYTSS